MDKFVQEYFALSFEEKIRFSQQFREARAAGRTVRQSLGV